MEIYEDAFINTFEATAFQFLNPIENPLSDYDGAGYSVGLCDFNGAINGTFGLLIHDDAVMEYLNFLFGDEPETEITDELKSDSVKELANVICGNMISKCVNAQAADYKIEKPQFLKLDSLKNLPEASRYTFYVDGNGKICGFFFYVK